MANIMRMQGRRFVWLLLAVVIAGAGAGLLTAWLTADGGSRSLTVAPPVAAESVNGSDGQALGYAQPYDPAVSFPSTLSGLPNPPSHLLVDASGTLWFPLFTGGGSGDKLYRYDPEAAILQSYDLPNSPGSGLFSAIAQAPDGRILVAYGYLVLDFDAASGAFKQLELPQPPTNLAEQSIERGTWVTDMAVDASGKVYVSRMNTAAVTAVDIERGTVTEIPIPASFGAVMEVAAGKDGIYLSNWLGGPDTGRQMALLSPGGEFTSVAEGASGLVVRVDGSVYAATAERALAVLSAGKASALATADLAPSLTGMKDYLAVDGKSGVLWFAGRDVGTVARTGPDGGSVAVFQLPSYVIPAAVISCPVGAPCHDVISTTRVDGLAVAPNGDLYFSDGTLNRIGVIRAQ